jgi:DNA transposition AAA+ family ATPase
MKKVFVKTQNAKNFINLMNNIKNRPENVPGMALVYGEPGLGKSKAVLWWVAQNEAVYIRGTNLMTGRWLIQEIVEELGEIPYHYSIDLFKQCVRVLAEKQIPIIVDEVDYLTTDPKTIETIRDLHDKTNVPIIFVGMAMAKNKLKRYKHLYDRISEIVQFKPFSHKDVKDIVTQLSEVEMTECAVRFIYTKFNRFRQIVRIINRAEQIAAANGLNTIDEITLKEFIKDDTEENPKTGEDAK